MLFISFPILTQGVSADLVMVSDCDLGFERHPWFEDHWVRANEPKTEGLIDDSGKETFSILSKIFGAWLSLALGLTKLSD